MERVSVFRHEEPNFSDARTRRGAEKWRREREPTMTEARVSFDDGERRAQDHWSVNLAESWEIAFWTRELGCTEEQLRAAVQAVGKTAGQVRAYLANHNSNPTRY